MVRRFIALTLIVALISANFASLLIFAGFELNRNYIAAKLCENRDKPWMHCNGKCYFMKKVKQAQDKEKNEERQSQKNLIQEAVFAEQSNFRFYSQMLQVIQVPTYRIALPVVYLSIFQPPRLAPSTFFIA